VISQNRLAYARIALEWEKRLATTYDHLTHERCRAMFLRHLKGDRVLDAGCGLGLDSLAFAAAGLRVTATDITMQFLQRLRRQNRGLGLAVMDMTSPCLRPESFDGIYAFASFLHIPREMAGPSVAGFARLLSPGGILFMHHVLSTKGFCSYEVEDLLVADNPAFCSCHSEEEICELLIVAGFRIIQISHIQGLRPPTDCAVRNGLKPYQVVASRAG
jgi:SAM-dependent methyltransferase